jgi:hypothetical protein
MSRTSHDQHEDSAVSSEPVEVEEGEPVVICQQNAGPGNQVGAGEFKRGAVGRTAEQAPEEQDQLEADAPIDAPQDQGELVSYAEQEQLPQLGGSEEAKAQRRAADHVEDERAGGGDPLSGSGGAVHERSRRHRASPGAGGP